MKTICLAVTGASGAPYAFDLMKVLLHAPVRLSLLLSSAAEIVIRQELGIELPADEAQQQAFLEKYFDCPHQRLTVYGKKDWFAPVASGSNAPDAMVICPASGGTLSAIACGASNNLIERAADVVLKERKQLILVPRETPYSQIHLENMLKLTQMGAIVLPASPGFYHGPESIEDLVRFITARIADQLGLKNSLTPRWGQSDESEQSKH